LVAKKYSGRLSLVHFLGNFDDAVKNLIRITRKIDTSKVGEPVMMAIIAGTGMAKQRENGVCVIPIECPNP
jgi:hypothetical protein